MNEFNQNIAQKELFELAQKKVKKRRDFYIHLFVYSIGISFWLLKKYTDLPLHFFPIKYINWFVMAIWTVAICIQALELLLGELLFGKKWEARKMKQFMREQSQKQTWE